MIYQWMEPLTASRRHSIMRKVGTRSVRSVLLWLFVGGSVVACSGTRSSASKPSSTSVPLVSGRVHLCDGGMGPPPARSFAVTVLGHAGNDWQLHVGQGVALRMQVVVRPEASVTTFGWDIAAAGASYPGPTAWSVVVAHGWRPGTHDAALRWSGRNDSGHQVAPGVYRLYANATTNNDRSVACRDGSGQGVERHIGSREGGGLGLLLVP